MKNDNEMLIARIRGVAAQPATPETDKDPANPNVLPGWKDPTCPKCGLVLGNYLAYSCGHSYCPAGLNR